MSTSQNNVASVSFADACFIVTLSDGREIRASLTSDTFPRLWYATPEERARYEVRGKAIHWPDLNEDVRVSDLMEGIDNSGESARSVKNWLQSLQEFRCSPARKTQTFTEWDLKRKGAWR